MRADRQSRVWPYVGLLLCLFTLSVTAPRAWQRAALRYRQGDSSQQPSEVQPAPKTTAQNSTADYSLAGVAATQPKSTPAEQGVRNHTPPATVRVSSSDERLAMRTPYTDAQTDFLPQADALTSEQAGAELPQNAPADTASTEPSDPADNSDISVPEAHPPSIETPTEESPSSELTEPALVDTEISSLEDSAVDLNEPVATEPTVTDQQSTEADSPSDAEEDEVLSPEDRANSLAWAAPQLLLEQMVALETFPTAADWVAGTRTLIEQLSAQPLPASDIRAQLLADLQTARKQIEQMAASEQDWTKKAGLLRVQFGLARRLEVWEAIHGLGAPLHTQIVPDDQASLRLEQCLVAVNATTKGTREGEAWRRSVQFDALQAALGREDETPGERQRLARQALGRMVAARANPEQQSVANSAAVTEFDVALREWAADEINLCRLLGDLEQFEANRLPHLAESISEQRQSLLYSTSEAEQAVGKRIEQHYRNANVRMAISEDLMNRFLPKPQVFDASVDDMIMGASVSGYSRTLNQLKLRLIPDERKIRLGLEAHGVVHSNTGASSGPVTIYNRGETTYVARKLVLVSATGLHIWPAVAEARAASDTRRIESKYDSIPLLNSIVRNMAQTQQDEAYDQAMTEVEARVENIARTRLDKEANPRINKLGQEYLKLLQGPLERLDLSPTPISLSTTADRAIVRFRVAGDDQLGAHTPRPCAPSDSLASVQVHESVLNNAADQLGLNGQTFTLPELHRTIADKLGLPQGVSDDLPEDAQVTFAAQDAVLIRCDDGKIWVTLSITELSQGRRKFKNFKATAVYHLVSHGLHTELERDGVVQLAGKRLNLGEQIALRGVVSKMFSQNRRPQVIPPEQAADARLTGLRVTQLVVVDGWIGLAIAPDRLVRGESNAGTSVNR